MVLTVGTIIGDMHMHEPSASGPATGFMVESRLPLEYSLALDIGQALYLNDNFETDRAVGTLMEQNKQAVVIAADEYDDIQRIVVIYNYDGQHYIATLRK